MKLEKINSLLGLAGNFAVLLGLIALAIEINDNTAAMRSQELSSFQERTQSLLASLMGEDIRRIYVKSLTEPEALTLEELRGITAYLSIRISNLERIYTAEASGIIRREDWESEILGAPIYLGSQFGRVFWENIKGDYAHRPEFVEAVDTALTTSPILPDDEYFLDLQNDLRNLRP